MKKRYRNVGTQPLEIPRRSGIFRDPGWEGEADPKDVEFYIQIGGLDEVRGPSAARRGTKKSAAKKAAKRAGRVTKVRTAFDTDAPDTEA